MTKTATTCLGGVTLHVKNVQNSLDFYSRLPGAKVVIPVQGGGKHQFAMVQIGTGRIGLLSGVPQMKFHLEIEASDLDEMYETLKSRGFEPEGPPEVRPWGERDFRVFDPDGYMVEFDQAG
jgi:catechol 2,3-dioxygenase-like lactoylglutathione lyase family enzyme